MYVLELQTLSIRGAFENNQTRVECVDNAAFFSFARELPTTPIVGALFENNQAHGQALRVFTTQGY